LGPGDASHDGGGGGRGVGRGRGGGGGRGGRGRGGGRGVGGNGGGEVGREEEEVEGVGGEVQGGLLFGEGVPSLLATWMRFWLLPPQRVTPVAGSIFRPLSQTHISTRELKNGHISKLFPSLYL